VTCETVCLSLKKPPRWERTFPGFWSLRRGAIGYNSTHAKVRQRFTIAHEIGHYVLQTKKSLHPRLFIDRYVAFRNDESSAGNDWQEVEANAFGAALLMPAHFVREEIKQRKLVLDDEDDLSTLANNFTSVQLRCPIA
jgi:Zn-dependent peptidase ImmA (M78 family)